MFVRELVQHLAPPPVILTVNPGFCHSEFMRHTTGFFAVFGSVMKAVLARTTEVGSRTLVAGACAGPKSHGEYMCDSTNQAVARWIVTDEGAQTQRRVYEQTIALLEKIEPGIGKNISPG